MKRRSGGRVYNPYAICAKSTGTSLGRSSCLPYYNFGRNSKIQKRELVNITRTERKALNKHRSRRTPRTPQSRQSVRRRRTSERSSAQLRRALESLVKRKY